MKITICFLVLFLTLTDSYAKSDNLKSSHFKKIKNKVDCQKIKLVGPIYPYKLKNGFYTITKSLNHQTSKLYFDEVIPTNYNYFKVKSGDNWGLINDNGELIIPIEFKIIDDENKDYIVAFNKQFGWIFKVFNRFGKELYNSSAIDFGVGIRPKVVKNLLTKWWEEPPYEERCVDKLILFSNNESKIIDINENINRGNDCLGFQSNFFENGTSIVSSNNNGLIIIDASLNTIGKIQNPNIIMESNPYLGENRYGFKNQEGYYAIYNIQGERITPFRFKEIRNFKNNRALVVLETDEYGFIDRNGHLVIKLKDRVYENVISDFENNISINKNSIIDTTGKAMTLPKLPPNSILFIETFADNHFSFQSNIQNLFGIIGKNGQLIVPPKYNSISNFKNGYAIVEKNQLYGIINSSGREIIKPIYEKIYTLEKDEDGELSYTENNFELNENRDFKIFFNGLIKVMQDGESFFIDTLGNEYRQK